MIAFAYLLVVLFAAVSVGGIEILAGRLYNTSWSNLDGRLDLWQDTIRVVRDFRLTGTGLNTYGIAMLHYQTVPGDGLAIEAHNDYLQILTEGGLLLGLPILLALLLFIREVWRRFREGADDTATYWLRAGALTGLGAIALQEFLDFTLQMPGAAALFVVLVAIAIHRPSRGARDSSVLVRGSSHPSAAAAPGTPLCHPEVEPSVDHEISPATRNQAGLRACPNANRQIRVQVRGFNPRPPARTRRSLHRAGLRARQRSPLVR